MKHTTVVRFGHVRKGKCEVLSVFDAPITTVSGNFFPERSLRRKSFE